MHFLGWDEGVGEYTKLPSEREFCSNVAFYNMTKEGTSLVRISG